MITKKKRSTAVVKPVIAEIAGWYGMLAIVISYITVSFGAVSARSLTYQLLNLTGAIGLAIIAYSKGVKQSVILNIFWSCIAIVAIVTILA